MSPLRNTMPLLICFVLPSHRDVWGMVLNEAMVCGLPIITTSEVGAATDLVARVRMGLLFRSMWMLLLRH